MAFRVVDPNDVSSSESSDSEIERKKRELEEEAKKAKESPELYDPLWKDAIKLTHDGGVKKKIIREGYGDKPVDGAHCSIHYDSKYSKTGKIFKSSRKQNIPLTFPVGNFRVIRGWDIGIASMKIGEISEFRVSPMYGYGKDGDGSKQVPPNTWLDFEIELIDWHTWERLNSDYLYKKCIKEGIGDMYDVADTSGIVYISYIGKIFEKNKIGNNIFTKVNNIQFIVDDDPSMPIGFHKAIKSMNNGEISEFKILPEFGYKKKEQGKLIAEQKGKDKWFGNQKLGIKYNDVLYFKIELHKYKNLISRWKMTPSQLFDIGGYYKNRGKHWYTKKEWLYAKMRYEKAIEYFDAQENMKKKSLIKQAKHLIHLCRNNIGLCYINMKEYNDAIYEINRTLQPYSKDDIDNPPTNKVAAKAYRLRARAQMESALFDEAILSLNESDKWDPDCVYSKVLRKDINKAKNKLKKDEKKVYGGSLNKDKLKQ